ncbi:hypothetical protein ITJ57_18945 [Plantibacter sp. VKM Ac-2880]|uniref:hypothetical protein n=1 Tax=Plantibacter sp. VKM Ac-2880 TaxID=2783827 RepID=UPI00188ED95F|nr:hypothetical protein [Plantibacter sp. VKM Ac-2880]MBF4570851.1 hypothetical protein [Plantibacter sp. VKM Ac-2880]
MITRMRLTPARIAAQLALGVPMLAMGLLLVSNVPPSGPWDPVIHVVGALASIVSTVGVLSLANHAANTVADRVGSKRLPWLAYGATLTALWALVIAAILTGAQFQATDAGTPGEFTIWAAGAALVSFSALVTALTIGTIATRRAIISSAVRSSASE